MTGARGDDPPLPLGRSALPAAEGRTHSSRVPGDASGPYPLLGRHAVVTGGARGIGAAIAHELARLGAQLTLMGRTLEPLESRAEEIRQAHGQEVRAVPVDVTDAERVRAAFAQARATLGAPAILVNNAGAAESAPFKRTDPALWRQMLETNLTAAYLCTAEVLPDAIAAGFGRIVNVASTAGLRGYAYLSAYCAAKHGLVGLTRALALETARTGVTVNAVCPGYADTEMTVRTIENIAAKTGRSREEARAELESFNPQGRLVEPHEVATTVGWLCLPSSAAITGQAIAIAGGEVM